MSSATLQSGFRRTPIAFHFGKVRTIVGYCPDHPQLEQEDYGDHNDWEEMKAEEKAQEKGDVDQSVRKSKK